MDCAKTGNRIRTLRKGKGLTQQQLAEQLGVTAKAVSKWENGGGCPDVSLLGDLAAALGADLEQLLTGEANENEQAGGNMKKLQFYVCPHCGNLMTAAQPAGVSCCGKKLTPLVPQRATEGEKVKVELMENEYFVSTDHPMTKEHHITFFAFLTGDTLILRRQYAEWDAQTRIPRLGHGKLMWYCTQHGLFEQLV